MALQTITKDILTRTDGSSLLDLPYDLSWVAGYDKEWVPEDIEVKTYGQAIMARPGEFSPAIGQWGVIDTGSTGAIIIVDVFKNDTTIFTTKPQFPEGTAWMDDGILSTTTFIAGDRITFKVTQVGSAIAGKGLRFTLKCRV